MLVQHKRTEKRGMFFIPGEDDEMIAELVYSFQEPDTLLLEHTEVDEELRGQKVGFDLVQAAVEYARQNQYKLIPLCSFAKAVMDRKQDFNDVRA
ncbi:MAG TPA: GNAT family N-acetyltransferase [Flavisolibacter sp.]|jgi:predicted GNAT family acetyltransferase|nr:GNAT family N-acetyltransferase [Flavisolibacter sp.]